MQKRNDSKEKQFEELVIDVKSVVKVNKGGRQRRYSATVVIGDRKGKVGLGIGKANEVPDAIKKAMSLAGAGDVILVAGKGHEDFVTFGSENIPYTDQETVTELLKEGN